MAEWNEAVPFNLKKGKRRIVIRTFRRGFDSVVRIEDRVSDSTIFQHSIFTKEGTAQAYRDGLIDALISINGWKGY